jgi:N-acetylglucosaminyldiphosphoundecaprenol N-acetyl-beta-D-mannosaminyltransferase
MMLDTEMELVHDTSFYGIRLSAFTKPGLEAYIHECLSQDQARVFYGNAVYIFSKWGQYPELHDFGNNADLVVTDGRVLYLLARLSGVPLQFDISIPYLTELVLELADVRQSSVMILGSTEQRNATASDTLRSRYPGLTVFEGFSGGRFEPSDYEEIIGRVNASEPDVLLIGVSTPKKERFVAECRDSLKAKVIIPCGGMVDVLAGEVQAIPRRVKTAGLGWAWRLGQEPTRLAGQIRDSFVCLAQILTRITGAMLLGKKADLFLPEIYGISPPPRRQGEQS